MFAQLIAIKPCQRENKQMWTNFSSSRALHVDVVKGGCCPWLLWQRVFYAPHVGRSSPPKRRGSDRIRQGYLAGKLLIIRTNGSVLWNRHPWLTTWKGLKGCESEIDFLCFHIDYRRSLSLVVSYCYVTFKNIQHTTQNGVSTKQLLEDGHVYSI